jgi:hypothetical protein
MSFDTIGAFLSPRTRPPTFNAGSTIFFGVRIGSTTVFNGAASSTTRRTHPPSSPHWHNPVPQRIGGQRYLFNVSRQSSSTRQPEFLGTWSAANARITTGSVSSGAAAAGNATIANGTGGGLSFAGASSAGTDYRQQRHAWFLEAASA